MKYKIDKQFFQFSYFKPPIGEKFLKFVVPHMKAPGYIYKDPSLEVSCHEVKSYDGDSIKCIVMSPKGVREPMPCLIYLHGGGFVLSAADYHYKNCMRYAKEIGCKIVFVDYRLAPGHPHPAFFEDCYAAMCWTYENADKLGIDRSRIGVGGDSAGSTLSVGVCMMARDRVHPIKIAFQMLPYPFLDARNNSESCKKYTDTPMWNSTLSTRIAPYTKVDKSRADYFYYSPVEADDFQGLPPAYIETAEFDCLHDDGILYAEKLREAGIHVTLNETLGTMHGFDIVQGADKTKEAIKARISFMSRFFK